MYTQSFTGGTDVPVGFTLEKGFTDIAVYLPFYGCRVNKMNLDFNIDSIAAVRSRASVAESLAFMGSSLWHHYPPACGLPLNSITWLVSVASGVPSKLTVMVPGM